jgi:hypothetical protein
MSLYETNFNFGFQVQSDQADAFSFPFAPWNVSSCGLRNLSSLSATAPSTAQQK